MRKVLLVALMCAMPACGLIVRQAVIGFIAVRSYPKSVEIQIDKSFIERLKNIVTYDVTLTVDKATRAVHRGYADGDLHFSGRSDEVGLPCVAEISNAASQKEAVDLVHRTESAGGALKVTGVWRLWAEHAGGDAEEQGQAVEAAETSNPLHVFEIHPVTRLEGLSLLNSFRPVRGFRPGEARRTFRIYENAVCKLTVDPSTVTIVLQPGLFNSVDFVFEPDEDSSMVVNGGRLVTGSVYDTAGNLVVKGLRMVFTKDTEPERAVKLLVPGQRMHAWGIPRLNLAEISRRASASATNPAVLTGPLPYEVVVIGVYRIVKQSQPRRLLFSNPSTLNGPDPLAAMNRNTKQ